MTHTPTLPNGFSRDFSAVPDASIIVYFRGKTGGVFCDKARLYGDRFETDDGFVHLKETALCWCPIPTPGDAVLKELAEEGK